MSDGNTILRLLVEKRALLNMLRTVLNVPFPKDEHGTFCPACFAYLDESLHFEGCTYQAAKELAERMNYD